MTKSEAKAIETRTSRALHLLQNEMYSAMTMEEAKKLHKHLARAIEEVSRVREMAVAKLGD